jgi:hypothetical protein
MAASRTPHGVGKSGSPTPREITPDMVWARSKNFRIPDGGTASTMRESGLPGGVTA